MIDTHSAAKDSGAIIGIDSGGTFTDVTMLDPVTGQIWNSKTPSTPEDPSLGFGHALGKILSAASLTSDSVGRVLHGTTVATNLILEHKGPPTAMLVTKGFR